MSAANDPDEIVFTGGATAAINLVAHGFGSALGPRDEILFSGLEHHSQHRAVANAARLAPALR